MAACGNSGSGTFVSAPNFPPPSNAIPVPAGVSASNGYQVSVFAKSPSGSTKPDSLVAIGQNVFVGFGDDLNPDGTAGPSGKTSTEIVEYSLSGQVEKTFSVPGHNDGLMALNSSTLWAMSNEDANPTLTAITISSGAEQTYVPQAGLLNGGLLPPGGGLDDMVLVGGVVYTSASNPTPNTGTCPANSTTPGCPNGIASGSVVYALSLNSDGKTFNLTPVLANGTNVTNMVNGATSVLNATDPDSEAVTPDGTTLVVDSQQDGDLVFIKNPGAGQVVSYLPLTLNGVSQQVDDTRFAPSAPSFLLDADVPANLIYRIDGTFPSGSAFSSGQTAVLQLNLSTGVFTPVVSGMQAPHGAVFVTGM